MDFIRSENMWLKHDELNLLSTRRQKTEREGSIPLLQHGEFKEPGGVMMQQCP